MSGRTSTLTRPEEVVVAAVCSVVAASPDPVTRELTHYDVVRRMARELRITKRRAAKHLAWLDTVVKRCRDRGGATYLSRNDVWLHHRMYARMVPASTIAAPGSLQADIESVLLNRAAGEFGLLHAGFRNGKVEYCTAMLIIEGAR